MLNNFLQKWWKNYLQIFLDVVYFVGEMTHFLELKAKQRGGLVVGIMTRILVGDCFNVHFIVQWN